ncbi:CoA transferase, partial [Escherichia coli]|nr:CoA transferase [Escherichia coli]
KRSVALNLKSEEGHTAALELIGSADILISNMRIDALRRLGMDYESLSAKFPKLIYVHAQGFRPDSDRAGLAAYDETVQAASGLLDIAQ